MSTGSSTPTSCGDEFGPPDDECGYVGNSAGVAVNAQTYVHGWAVMPRLREEIALSNLLSRLEVASAKNVPPSAFSSCHCRLTLPAEQLSHCWPTEVHFLCFQERKQHVRTRQQRPVCLSRAVCGRALAGCVQCSGWLWRRLCRHCDEPWLELDAAICCFFPPFTSSVQSRSRAKNRSAAAARTLLPHLLLLPAHLLLLSSSPARPHQVQLLRTRPVDFLEILHCRAWLNQVGVSVVGNLGPESVATHDASQAADFCDCECHAGAEVCLCKADQPAGEDDDSFLIPSAPPPAADAADAFPLWCATWTPTLIDLATRPCIHPFAPPVTFLLDATACIALVSAITADESVLRLPPSSFSIEFNRWQQSDELRVLSDCGDRCAAPHFNLSCTMPLTTEVKVIFALVLSA